MNLVYKPNLEAPEVHQDAPNPNNIDKENPRDKLANLNEQLNRDNKKLSTNKSSYEQLMGEHLRIYREAAGVALEQNDKCMALNNEEFGTKLAKMAQIFGQQLESQVDPDMQRLSDVLSRSNPDKLDQAQDIISQMMQKPSTVESTSDSYVMINANQKEEIARIAKSMKKINEQMQDTAKIAKEAIDLMERTVSELFTAIDISPTPENINKFFDELEAIAARHGTDLDHYHVSDAEMNQVINSLSV